MRVQKARIRELRKSKLKRMALLVPLDPSVELSSAWIKRHTQTIKEIDAELLPLVERYKLTLEQYINRRRSSDPEPPEDSELEGEGRKPIYTHSLDGGRAGVSKASGFIMRKMAEAKKSGYKTAPKGFDYKRLANKAQSGINEPTAKNSLRSTYGASPFIAKYFSGLQNPPKNETIAQKNARLHLLADYLLRLSQKLVKNPTEANVAQAEKAVMNRQPPALREHFGNQNAPRLEIVEEKSAVAPTPPNPAKHTKASLNALSTQQIRDILFVLQGHPEKAGKKMLYSATPGKGRHKNKGEVIDEVLRLQGTAPVAEEAPQNELVMDTGVRLTDAEAEFLRGLEGLGRYRGGGPVEDAVAKIEALLAKGGLSAEKTKYIKEAIAVADLLGKDELLNKVRKAVQGTMEPLPTAEKEEEEEEAEGEPNKKLAEIVVQIKELVSKPTDANLPEMEEDEEPLEIDEADLSRYFGLFGDDPFYNYDYINYAKGNYNRWLVLGVCKDYKEEGFIGGITTVGVLQHMDDEFQFDLAEIAGIIAGGDEEKAKTQIKKDVSKVKDDMIIYVNNFKEYNKLYEEAVKELYAYADKLKKPDDYEGETDVDTTDVENFVAKEYLDDRIGKYSLFWDPSSPSINYHEALLDVVVEEWNRYRELSKINPDTVLLAFRAKKDYLKDTIVYDRYIEDFKVMLESLEAFLVDTRRLAKAENVAKPKKVKKPKTEEVRSDAFLKQKAKKGIGSLVILANWKGPELTSKDGDAIEREENIFFSNKGARKGSYPELRRSEVLKWSLGKYNERKSVDIHYPPVRELVTHMTTWLEQKNKENKEDGVPLLTKQGLAKNTLKEDLVYIKDLIIEQINKKAGLNIETMSGRSKKVAMKENIKNRGSGLVMRGI